VIDGHDRQQINDYRKQPKAKWALRVIVTTGLVIDVA
jgi:hypothetical protein